MSRHEGPAWVWICTPPPFHTFDALLEQGQRVLRQLQLLHQPLVLLRHGVGCVEAVACGMCGSVSHAVCVEVRRMRYVWKHVACVRRMWYVWERVAYSMFGSVSHAVCVEAFHMRHVWKCVACSMCGSVSHAICVEARRMQYVHKSGKARQRRRHAQCGKGAAWGAWHSQRTSSITHRIMHTKAPHKRAQATDVFGRPWAYYAGCPLSFSWARAKRRFRRWESTACLSHGQAHPA
eukprot:365172-Chlamydomonas_euryale.AAC.5